MSKILTYPTVFVVDLHALQKNMQLIVVIIGLIMEKQKVDKEILMIVLAKVIFHVVILDIVIMNKIVTYPPVLVVDLNALQKNMLIVVVSIGLIMEKQKEEREILTNV